MKSIIFFMLVGLSLFNEGHCEDEPDPQISKNCLLQGLEQSAITLKEISLPLCCIEMKEENDEKKQKCTKELIKLVEDAGCIISDITGVDTDEILKDGGDIDKDILEKLAVFVKETLTELGLGEKILKYVCDLKESISNCLEDIIKLDKEKLLIILQKLECKEQLDMNIIDEILRDLTCPLNTPLPVEALNGASAKVKDLVALILDDNLKSILTELGLGEKILKYVCDLKECISNCLKKIIKLPNNIKKKQLIKLKDLACQEQLVVDRINTFLDDLTCPLNTPLPGDVLNGAPDHVKHLIDMNLRQCFKRILTNEEVVKTLGKVTCIVDKTLKGAGQLVNVGRYGLV